VCKLEPPKHITHTNYITSFSFINNSIATPLTTYTTTYITGNAYIKQKMWEMERRPLRGAWQKGSHLSQEALQSCCNTSNSLIKNAT
jgi:hypothetical protein